MPRFAAIDVGSNALRLRVIEASAPSRAEDSAPGTAPGPPAAGAGEGAATGPWRDLATLRAPVRLGAEVFLSGRLAPASIGQACDALREFKSEMDRVKVEVYRAIATSAVREAKNGGT
ncbi:MAG: Ppx/GppA family phosphatase, partial [Myxococcales bacterium]|nr:Ppx/GppA family phosphatase [Myxococcales bacterium]